MSPSLHNLCLLSKPCHHLCIRELLPIDTDAGTVFTLLGSEIRKQILHRPFTPRLKLLQEFRCQPQVLCGQLVLFAKILHQPDLPGLLEHLQLLFLGTEDFQSGITLGIEFFLLRPTCRLDLIQSFLYPRLLLTLNLCKSIFEFGLPDGTDVGCNVPLPLLHHPCLALTEPRLCLHFIQALLPKGIRFTGDGIQLVLQVSFVECIRLIHNVALKVGINLRFLCQTVFVDEVRICSLLEELEGFTIQSV